MKGQTEEAGSPPTSSRGSRLDLQPKEEKLPPANMFRFATKSQRTMMYVGGILMFASGGAIPAFSYVFGELLDGIYTADKDKAADKVQILAGVFFAIGIGMWIAVSVGISFWVIASTKQTLLIRKKYLHAMFHQEVGWFDQNGMDCATTLLNDTNTIQEGMSDKFANAIYFLGTFVIGIVFGLIKGWQLTLVILACVPVLGVAGFLAFKLMGGSNKVDPNAKAQSIAGEYLAAIRTVQAFSLHQQAVDKYCEKLLEARKLKLKKGFTVAFTMGFVWFAVFAAYALSLWYGSNLITDQDTNPQTGEAWTGGDVIAVFFSVLIGGMSLGQAGPGLQSHKEGKDVAAKIWKILDRKPEIDVFGGGRTDVNLAQPIVFDNVRFRYPTAPDVEVLKGLSFTIEPGQFVALVGPSGSGKSTVAQLLERFYDPTEGSIRVGNADWKDLDLRVLRGNIGIVSQEPVLFNKSVAENIRFAKPEATMEEVEAAAKLANAHEFISSLPNGYNTSVGEAGSQMSGGQKQRIAIARAIISQPKILILDEATSALDTQSERLVQEALDRVMKGRTILAVAHRLSTIAHADKILVISNGVLHEQGTHNELMKVDGMYAGLIKQQKLGVVGENSRSATVQSILFDVDTNTANSKQQQTAENDAMTTTTKTKAIAEENTTKIKTKATTATTTTAKDLKGGSGGKGKEEEEKQPDVPKELMRDALKRTFALMTGVWYWAIIGIIGAAMNGAVMPCFAFVFTEMLRVFYECVGQPCDGNERGWSSGGGRNVTVCYGSFVEEGDCLDGMQEDADFVACMFVVLACGGFLSYFFSTYAFQSVGQTMTLKLRKQLFTRMLHQEIGWFDDPANTTGSLTTRLTADTETINEVVSLKSAIHLQNIVTLLTGLAIAFAYGWQLALVLLALVPFIMASGMVQFKMMAGSSRENKVLREEVGHFIMESARNFRTVCAFNAQTAAVKDVVQRLETAAKQGKRQGVIGAIFFGMSNFVMFGMYGTTFSVAAVLIRKEIMTPDHVLKVFFALAMAAVGVGQTGGMAPDSSKFNGAVLGVFSTLDRTPQIESDKAGKSIQVQGKVSLNKVHFAYPQRPHISVMNGVSLEILKGKRVAFVGASGSGKSTVIRLVLRLYDAVEGSVCVDGTDVREAQLRDLRAQLGLVEQEPVLFTATVRENIRFGRPGASDDDVVQAAREANAHDFIMELQNGYDTMIGVGFVQLSGGQKQRIAISRALIRRPNILLLDEATSALDSKSEKVVNDVLASCSQGRTTLVIAHRLSTIKDADVIVVVQSGNIVETGTHDELVAANGVYASLVSHQQLENNQ